MSSFDSDTDPETISRIAGLLLEYADPETSGEGNDLVELLERAAGIDVEVTAVIAAGLLRSVMHGIAGQFGKPAAASVLRQLAATAMVVSDIGGEA